MFFCSDGKNSCSTVKKSKVEPHLIFRNPLPTIDLARAGAAPLRRVKYK